MAEEFTSDSDGTVRPNSDSGEPQRERIDFLIVGSREGIREEILKFYKMGFAAVEEWSAIMPLLGTNKLMTVLMRYRTPGSSDSSTRQSGPSDLN